MEDEFFKKKNNPNEKDVKMERLLRALEFLNKQIKKDAAITNSDFIVCFLEAFHMIFPKKLKDNFSKIDRQNILLCFIKTVDILIKKDLTGEEHFKQALIVKVLYVLRLAVDSSDTVDMGIYCLQILLNAIGMKQTINYFSSIFSTVVHAFLMYPDRKKIKRYV